MSYNPFQEAKPEEISRLGFTFIKRPYVYYSESCGLQHGQLYQTDEKTWMTIKRLLEGDENGVIAKKDKVLILPGNTMPQFRIKDYLKNVGATITRDPSKATVVLGHSKLGQDLSNWQQAKLADMMFKIDDIMEIQIAHEDTWEDTVEKLKLTKFKTDREEAVISRSAYDNGGYDTNVNWMKERLLEQDSQLNEDEVQMHYLYPVCLQVVYNVLARKVKVISQDVITNNAHSHIYLKDKDTFRSIKQMLNGSQNDVNVAVELLCNCNIDDATYHLWKLACDHGSQVAHNNNTKNLRHFKDVSDWDMLCGYDAEEYAEYLLENNMLTPELMDLLAPDIQEKAKEHWQHTQYDIQLILKPEYQEIYEPKEQQLEEQTV